MTATSYDIGIFDKSMYIPQQEVGHPSFKMALAVTGGALCVEECFLRWELALAQKADQDFHSSHPLQALAVVSPGEVKHGNGRASHGIP